MPSNSPPRLLFSTASQANDSPRVDMERDLPMHIEGEFDVAVTGDIVMTRPISQLDDERVQQAIAPIRDADLAIGNLEQTIADWRRFNGFHYGVNAFLIMADPHVADELANLGFHILSRANNRLSDFGPEGNRETDAHLRRVGISPAGYGEHLAEARAPVYHDVPRGRVSAIAVTSSLNHGQDQIFAASARIGNSNGRPGANNIRVSRTIKLPPRAWELLNELLRESDYAFPGPFAIMPTVMVFEDRVKVGNEWYMEGERGEYTHDAHPDDLSELLKHTRNASLFSNFTVFTIHSHQWTIDPEKPAGGLAGETPEPPDFLTRLAHDAIDNGCDLFSVHGPFDFRAIEIYKNKPIFYGLGSFIRQAYMQEVLPWETYRRFEFGETKGEGLNPYATEVTDAELLTTRTARHPAQYFEGATATCTYKDNRIEKITLHPVDLSIGGPFADLGIPRRAQPEVAERILTRIQTNSGKFGTKLVLENGLGVVKIG